MKKTASIVVVAFVMGALAHAYFSAWGLWGPSDANECVMKNLKDMQNSKAVDSLFQICRWNYGKFGRSDLGH